MNQVIDERQDVIWARKIAASLNGVVRDRGPFPLRFPGPEPCFRRSPRRGTNPFGFTLVELLVGISIIGVLVGLLLPAVQASRESARRIECGNHLKQIGLSFQLHHGTYKYFPSGGRNWDDPPTYIQGMPQVGAAQFAGWGFQVLPFLEAKSVWDAGPVVAIGAPNPTFFCPSRRRPQVVTIDDNYMPLLTGAPLEHALCDYAASNRELTGVVQRLRPRTLADVVDGTSMSLLVAEKRMNRRLLGAPQDDDNEGYTAGWNEDTVRRTTREPLPDYAGIAGDGDGRFGSSHPGTFQAVFVDGSVRPVRYTIDATVFEYLGNIQDGQAISNDE